MKAAAVHPGEANRRVKQVQARHGDAALSLPLMARRHPLVAEIERGLIRCGVPMNDRKSSREIPLIIGVSGGADSTALLIGCVAIQSRQSGSRIRPIIVHVHHHLRPSADDDAKFVSRLCSQLNVRMHVRHVYPKELAGNVSANARRLRYQSLCEVAIAEGATFIAVAHQGEDQLETMIAAICRGAGLEGLAGMPWSRSLEACCGTAFSGSAGGGLRLIRPLLGLRRTDCEELCGAAGVQWRDDPSNVDMTKARARLRHDVLPVLEDLWPDAPRRVTVTSEILSAAIAALNHAVHNAFGNVITNSTWSRDVLSQVPPAILAAGLRKAALALVPEAADELNQKHLMQVAELIVSEERRPHKFNWPRRLNVHVTSKHVALTRSVQSN